MLRTPYHRRAPRHVTFVASTALLVAACATPRREGASDSASGAAPGTAPGAMPGAPAGDVTSGPATDGARTGAAPVTLELDRTRYAAGDVVTLRIVNHDAAAYGYSACTRIVEHSRGGKWEAVPEEGRMCTMNLQILAARQTVTATAELPRPLAAGDYRIAIVFSREEGPVPGGRMATSAPPPVRATSAAFRVE